VQKKRVAADLSAWEDHQRRKAAEDLQQMELDAQLQAEVDKQQVGLPLTVITAATNCVTVLALSLFPFL
jgi:hypothetical protein